MKQLLILEKEMLKSGEVEDKYGKLQQSNLRSFLPFSLSYIDLPSYIDLKTNNNKNKQTQMLSQGPQILSLSVKEIAPPPSMGHHLYSDANARASVL